MPDRKLSYRTNIQAADAELVREMVRGTGFFSRDEEEIAVELVEERISKGSSSGYEFIFVLLDGTVAGYACYGKISGTQSSFDLYWIVVDSKVQRAGIGRKLLDMTEQEIIKHSGDKVYADTSSRDQYAPTRRFYERNGFLKEAELRNFYSSGDSKIIYVKKLFPV